MFKNKQFLIKKMRFAGIYFMKTIDMDYYFLYICYQAHAIGIKRR